jgi:hypothetical protein
MALKFIQQDATTLREAYQERKAEYDALRTAGRWPGAVLYAGTLLELAFKLVICKHLGITNLPTIFQVHDLDLLLCCSGQQSRFGAGTALHKNFSKIQDHWTMALCYEGAVKTQQDSDDCDKALFDPSYGLLTLLSQYF